MAHRGDGRPDPPTTMRYMEKPVRFLAQSSQRVALVSIRSPQVPHKLKNRTPSDETSREMLGRQAVKSGTTVGINGAFRDARHASKRFHTRRTNCMGHPSATVFVDRKRQKACRTNMASIDSHFVANHAKRLAREFMAALRPGRQRPGDELRF